MSNANPSLPLLRATIILAQIIHRESRRDMHLLSQLSLFYLLLFDSIHTQQQQQHNVRQAEPGRC